MRLLALLVGLLLSARFCRAAAAVGVDTWPSRPEFAGTSDRCRLSVRSQPAVPATDEQWDLTPPPFAGLDASKGLAESAPHWSSSARRVAAAIPTLGATGQLRKEICNAQQFPGIRLDWFESYRGGENRGSYA